MKYKVILCLILGYFFINSICAQTQSKRPKIGLTLSGGGAKGLAHIGILQAIDSAGLKIDFLTGTSMGSVVGGLYAAGYSGDSIEKMARPLDWGLLFSTSPQLNSIGIEEKSEYDKYALTLPFEKRKLKMGKGIIEGQELWLKLAEFFEPVYNITDFSKLSIPFKCIGTDLATGNAIEMDHGNIVTAIRASMAIPSVFTPVKYEDKLLVDGGVVNNFPVLDAKRMGADYVIGVNLNHGLSKSDELESSVDILMQIVFFKDAANFEAHKKECNLFILPELKDYSSGSFGSSDSIIDLGIETGRQYYPYFKRLADSLNALYGKNDFVKDRIPKNTKIKINKYSAEGFNYTKENFFFGLLGLKENKEYSHKEMNDAIHRVYGSRYYKIIRYDFLPDGNGNTEMHFNVEESPQTAVKFALCYNSFTQLGLKLNMTSRDLIFKESRALVSVSISPNPQLYAEYYKFINKSRTARAVLDFYYQAADFPIYTDFRLSQTLRSIYRVFDFQLQKNINQNSYFGAGQQLNHSQIKTKEVPTLLNSANNDYWYTYLTYSLNTTNKSYFTTKGWLVKANAGYVYSQNPKVEYATDDSTINKDSVLINGNNYVKMMISASHYSEINSKFSWSQNLSLAYIIEKNNFIGDQFAIGGINNVLLHQVSFIGMDVAELRTGSIASAQLGLQYKLSKKAYLIGRFNAALYDFHGKQFDNLTAKNNILTGYGLTFGMESVLGPIELTMMYCDQDAKLRNYINIGFTF